MMTIAIMQPYFFPYIGYWQLIHAVDRFIMCDDVNYIKGGWINRNRILINGEPAYITVPLQQSSQNRRICDIALQPSPAWRGKLVKMVETTYRKAPCFAEVFPVVERLIRHEAENLSDYLAHQVQTMAAFMGINAEFVVTSRCYKNDHLSGQARVLDTCKREGATTYINPQGGQALYDTETFRSAGLDLRFIVMRPLPYKQRVSGFVPYLSIIDALMEIGPVEIKQHLDEFDLIETAFPVSSI
ncbi:MAG: WbqC family protein [Planctomycetia bacterium]|nr:WbqC family protein [Planctomycetia bacterium]